MPGLSADGWTREKPTCPGVFRAQRGDQQRAGTLKGEDCSWSGGGPRRGTPPTWLGLRGQDRLPWEKVVKGSEDDEDCARWASVKRVLQVPGETQKGQVSAWTRASWGVQETSPEGMSIQGTGEWGWHRLLRISSAHTCSILKAKGNHSKFQTVLVSSGFWGTFLSPWIFIYKCRVNTCPPPAPATFPFFHLWANSPLQGQSKASTMEARSHHSFTQKSLVIPISARTQNRVRSAQHGLWSSAPTWPPCCFPSGSKMIVTSAWGLGPRHPHGSQASPSTPFFRALSPAVSYIHVCNSFLCAPPIRGRRQA